MARPAQITLAGFMGTGKSTVGRLVAQRLTWPFVDLDEAIEKRVGRTIADLFAAEGEAGFRKIERTMVQEATRRKNVVLAVGGGAVLDPDNRTVLSQAGLLVCLDARPDVIWERVSGERHRPLLNTDNPRGKIQDLLDQRRDRYAAISLHIDTSGLKPTEVADAVLSLYHTAGAACSKA